MKTLAQIFCPMDLTTCEQKHDPVLYTHIFSQVKPICSTGYNNTRRLHAFIICVFFIYRISVDFSIITWAFGKMPQVTSIWLMMIVYTLTAFPLFQACKANRKSWIPLPLPMWILCYLIYMSTFIYFPVAEISSHNLPPASTIILVAEQVS